MADKLPSTRPTGGSPASAGTSPAVPGIPGFQTRNMAILGGALAILWVTALATNSKVFVAIVAVITIAVVGLLAYVYRWAKKQQGLMELLKNANASPEARREALAKLSAEKGADKDVMNAIARAQLEAQEDPDKAIATLETIDLKKVPAAIGDDVRAFRAQMYLLTGRPQDARPIVEEIKITNAAQPQSRAMLAATVAETFARTGKVKEANDLLTTIKPEDPDFKEARVPLLYARIYAAFAAGDRDQVRKDLGALLREDVNLLGRFLMPRARVHPELQKIARDILQRDPNVRKMAQKQQSRSQRRVNR